ncbi:DUF1043 family protein [Gammaproteobacteria bacterium AS21]
MEENNIIIAIISLGVGAVIGYFAGRSSASNTSAQVREVDSLKAEINEYKESVANHFQHTASMINEMNESYQGVIHHLAKGSQDLCDAGTAKDIESRLLPKLASQNTKTTEDSKPAAQAQDVVEPPRDYAPKKADEPGALSENYGLTPKPSKKDEEPLDPSTIADAYDVETQKK